MTTETKSKSAAKKSPARKVDLAKFVTIWQNSDSPEAVAKSLGIMDENGQPDAGWARGRAGSLRRHGVPLKTFDAKRGPSIDYKALAALVKAK